MKSAIPNLLYYTVGGYNDKQHSLMNASLVYESFVYWRFSVVYNHTQKSYQYMHAVYTNGSNEGKKDSTSIEARIFKTIGHGQYTRSYITLN